MSSEFTKKYVYKPKITDENEILSSTDERGNELPVTRAQMKNKNLIPNGVACVLINPITREILLTKRAEGRSNAGAWEISAGHRQYEEDPKKACAREINEELGISLQNPILLEKTLLNNQSEKAWVHIFGAISDSRIEDMTFEENEVADARWLKIEELKNDVHISKFHIELDKLKQWILQFLISLEKEQSKQKDK